MGDTTASHSFGFVALDGKCSIAAVAMERLGILGCFLSVIHINEAHACIDLREAEPAVELSAHTYYTQIKKNTHTHTNARLDWPNSNSLRDGRKTHHPPPKGPGGVIELSNGILHLLRWSISLQTSPRDPLSAWPTTTDSRKKKKKKTSVFSFDPRSTHSRAVDLDALAGSPLVILPHEAQHAGQAEAVVSVRVGDENLCDLRRLDGAPLDLLKSEDGTERRRAWQTAAMTRKTKVDTTRGVTRWELTLQKNKGFDAREAGRVANSCNDK